LKSRPRKLFLIFMRSLYS